MGTYAGASQALSTQESYRMQAELEHEKDYVRAFYEQFRGQKVIVGFERVATRPGSKSCWKSWSMKPG